ncbi:NlpC/P60 family protein [Kutzneria chonburiensis]|uniref:NlpC/P60 family protein n=1 Tax=Kutzneria chonburiensis TaxID=1483604 RepID=UPI003B6381C7
MHELSSGTPAGGNGAPLLSGDLVFFDSEESNIVHVGIAISSTRMINAPNEALRRASTALVNWELGVVQAGFVNHSRRCGQSAPKYLFRRSAKLSPSMHSNRSSALAS